MIKLKLIPSPPITFKIETVKPSKPEEDKFVELDMTHGNQDIYPSDGKTMKRVVIHRPSDLVYSNIREGCNIGGIIGQMKPRKPEKSVTFRIVRNGTYGAQSTASEAIGLVSIDVNVQPPLQSKSVAPSTTPQNVTPDAGYYGLSGVNVSAIQTEEKTVTANGQYTPSSGKFFDEVNVNVQPDLEERTVIPTAQQQVITPSAGKDGISQVTVSAIPARYVDSSTVDALAGNVLSGKKAVVETGTGTYAVASGTMANNGAISGTIDGLTATSYTVPVGYTSGGTVSLTSDIEDALAAI